MTTGLFIAFAMTSQHGSLNSFHSVSISRASELRTASYMSLQYTTRLPILRLHSSIATGS